MQNDIVIEVGGGIARPVGNRVRVIVRDFDVEGLSDSEVITTPAGGCYSETIYEADLDAEGLEAETLLCHDAGRDPTEPILDFILADVASWLLYDHDADQTYEAKAWQCNVLASIDISDLSSAVLERCDWSDELAGYIDARHCPLCGFAAAFERGSKAKREVHVCDLSGSITR